MSDVAYLTIPGERVEAVTATVLGLYGARAEVLAASAHGFVEGADELAELEHARDELRAVENALADLGWPEAPSGRAAELVGPPLLLREVTRTALLDAADGVVEAVCRYEAGLEELAAVERAVDAVAELFGLFTSFERDSVLTPGRAG